MKTLRVIDSHTGGEPTRVVVEGFPDLGTGSMKERVEGFREKYDRYRKAVANEPRASDVVVGALIVPPVDKSCVTGVIYFNNAGYLGMCGHGTIGLVATLAHLGRIKPGAHRIETPVGVVTATLHADGSVSVENVASHREATKTFEVEGLGKVKGDIAYGGNWFLLIADHGLEISLGNIDRLTDYAWRARQAANAQGFPQVDHVELFGPATVKGASARNFVLCPGRAYDRSPCGTGTSAKLACLAADGKLAEGETWVQESVVGSLFKGSYRRAGDQVVPTITGSAWVNGDCTVILDDNDPYCWGIA